MVHDSFTSNTATHDASWGSICTSTWYKLMRSQNFHVFMAILFIGFIMSLNSQYFLSSVNIGNIAENCSLIAIATIGVTIIIITGGIDLSLGSVMALSAVVTIMVMNFLSQPTLEVSWYSWLMSFFGNHSTEVKYPGVILGLSLLAGLVSACAVGLFNGVLISVFGLSPFVTTLGTLSIARGLVYVLTDGRGSSPIGPDVDFFHSMASGQLFGIPMPLVYTIFIAILMSVVLRHTVWGRHVFAIGGNESAASLVGINVTKVKIQVYVVCSLATGFQGILMSSWIGSAPANMATGYELAIIAAAVVGGAHLAGGVGSAVGSILGCVLLEVIRNGLVLAQVNAYWQQALVGVIIVAAVFLDKLRSRIT